MTPLSRLLAVLDDPRRGLATVLCVVTFFFLLFCVLDQRPPNDHDDFYTADTSWSVIDYRDAPLWKKPAVLASHFRSGELHPQLAQTTLVGSLGTFGPSRFMFRATNLPFLLLLVLGTYLMGREIGGHRLGLLAAFIAPNVPMVINYSRKWDIQFHAACLTPLGIWFLLAALQSTGRRALKLWLAFGAWQGLRLYSHPIVLPDVAATFGLAFVVLWPHGRALGQRFAARLGLYVLSAATAFVVGLYYLGIAASLIGEPEYSLRRYLLHRGSYTDMDWWIESSLLAKANLLHDLLAEVIWLQALPMMSLLLLPGLLLTPVVLARRKGWEERRAGSRWLALLVLGVSLAQIPGIVLGTSNRAYLADWLFLVPSGVVLSLLALSIAAESFGSAAPTLKRRWSALLVLAGLLHHLLPLGYRLVQSDPIETPEAYNNLVMGPFTRSASGRHWTTHHVPSRFPAAGSVVAGTLAELGEDPGGTARFAVLDLTWDPSIEGRAGCRLGPPESLQTWSWSPPRQLNVWGREVSPWPFLFEGFRAISSVRPDHEVDTAASSWSVFRPQGTVDLNQAREVGGEITLPVVGGDEEVALGTAEEPELPEQEVPETEAAASEQPQEVPETVTDPGTELPRLAVVRLWTAPTRLWEADLTCHPDDRLPEGFMAVALQLVGARFPDARFLQELKDPTGWLVGRVIEWDRTRSYVGTSFLYDLNGSPDSGRKISLESVASGATDNVELEPGVGADGADAPGLGEPAETIEAGGEAPAEGLDTPQGE